jgi:glycosyltransferase involved in cell wall biosynthesis
MKITFSYAGKIGGLGQGYITSKTIMAAIETGCLYQLFASDFDGDIARKVGEAFKIKGVDEFVIMHGLVARALQRLGLTYYLSNMTFDNRVAKELKSCDVFHVFASQALNSIIKAKKLGAKVIADNPNTHPLNIRDVLAEEYKIWKVPYLPYNKIALMRRLRGLDMADRILVLSRTSYQSFINNGCPEKLLRIVPYGVDKELFRPRPKEDNKFRVLFIGQLSLRKGFQYLLEAWKLLKLKDAELVLAGGLKPDAVYALKKYDGIIDFKLRGPLADMESIARLYNQASIAVFPSIEEGFGMVVAEAMASGLPVIVSENVGAKDLITNGQDGFIVPVRNPQAIVEGISYFYENKAKRIEMGQKARLKVMNQSWQVYQDRLIEVYRELLGKLV